ncbi:hypothetical protein F4804DRAFT_113110 [Jackrogersella minutella]|nr:hypothetical protein F4804DRAFT_113110 [Jackrogersella minutella]
MGYQQQSKHFDILLDCYSLLYLLWRHKSGIVSTSVSILLELLSNFRSKFSDLHSQNSHAPSGHKTYISCIRFGNLLTTSYYGQFTMSSRPKSKEYSAVDDEETACLSEAESTENFLGDDQRRIKPPPIWIPRVRCNAAGFILV